MAAGQPGPPREPGTFAPMTQSFDVIVVGGGHAGCEAALAAARLGAATALITMDQRRVALMPCNPSIGGIAKSHLVFELDALGGEMARNADYTGIQFRVLNTRKGPAVQANRVQNDKAAYAARMAAVLTHTRGLCLVEGEVAEVWTEAGALRGVKLDDGEAMRARAVVLTPGTFLGGTLWIGKRSVAGGRRGERSASSLGQSLRGLGVRFERLKTGTPPRLARSSLDYARMEEQPGLDPAPLFSWAARRDGAMFHVEHGPSVLRPWPPGADQQPCFITRTTPETHTIISDNLARSALYGGAISGTGVRYCPSVEDKIVKFPQRESHHVFVEPEGRCSDLVYPNGISNSLPEEVQTDLVHSIPGMSSARIVHWAYAIEYDFADPTQLQHSMESNLVENLYLAGQINGTTGYEEAGAQGFMAGVNAVRKLRGEDAVVLKRHEAYIGVMIDDLVTKGTDEPYRMFTSRAEHRLMLRQDNARYRLLAAARDLGIADRAFTAETQRFEEATQAEMQRCRNTYHEGVSLAALLCRPGRSYDDLPGETPRLDAEVLRQVEIRLRYEGYIARELPRIARAEDLEGQAIPAGLDFHAIDALRYEAREKLSRVCPRTLGQASRIPGVNPADIAVLSVLLRRGSRALPPSGDPSTSSG